MGNLTFISFFRVTILYNGIVSLLDFSGGRVEAQSVGKKEN